jgi:replication initiation protein RepC|tara:strand:+ start:144217 stop:145266 length:1050 start_codon:yes stop_codon:yes gene_type:complete
MAHNIVKNTSGENGAHSHSRQQAYYALTLIKRLGKHSGYNAQMINLLDYYLSFTRDIDWEGKGAPIVYQSLCRTSYDFSLSVRQIQRIEKSLADKQLIRWHDSPNNKRYGVRDASGRLKQSFGVDLSPLIHNIPMLKRAVAQKAEQKTAWLSLKHSVHQLRKDIRALVCTQSLNVDDETSKAIEVPIRPNVTCSKLQTMVNILTALLNKLRQLAEKNFVNVDKNVVHKENTKSSNISITTTEPDILGLSKITYQDLSRYIHRSDRQAKLKNWHDIIRYAEEKRHLFGISDDIWRKSNDCMGNIASTITFLITCHGFNKEISAVYNPRAYFSALIKRAEQGRLYLDKAIY